MICGMKVVSAPAALAASARFIITFSYPSSAEPGWEGGMDRLLEEEWDLGGLVVGRFNLRMGQTFCVGPRQFEIIRGGARVKGRTLTWGAFLST